MGLEQPRDTSDKSSLPSLPRTFSIFSSTEITMSQSSTSAPSSSNYQFIFESAPEAYRKATKNDLASHPLLAKLESCDSLESIHSTLDGQILQCGRAQSAQNTNDRSITWLSSTVKVLYAFSTISGGVGLVSLMWLFHNRQPDFRF